jgi:predicted permease
MAHANEHFIASAMIILLGWGLRRFVLALEEARTIVKIVYNLTLPALVITTFASRRVDVALGILPVLSLAHGALMCVVGTFLLDRGLPPRERGLRSYLLPSFNVGLFAFPLVEAVLGGEAIKYLGMFDIGVALTAFIGSFSIARHFAAEPGSAPESPSRAIGKMLLSAPLLAYAAGIVLNLTGLRPPQPVLAACGILGRANMPLSLLILGMYLDLRVGEVSWGRIAQVLGVRYLFGAAAGVALYLLLPLDPLFRTVVLIGMVLPPPLITISFAHQFDYDDRFVGMLLNVASGVSFALVWIVISVLPPIR